MDPLNDGIAPAGFDMSEPQPELLSYDDTVPYEAQVEPQPDASSLASRIGRGKIYLLSDAASSLHRPPKRVGVDEDEDMEDADGLSEDPERRPNALFFTGLPISHLPTTRIFAYATHFDAHPLGLEWVSDTTCVLVFESVAAARRAHAALEKVPGEEPSIDDGSVTAKPIPIALWPADERISRTLGLGSTSTEDGEAERQRRRDGLSAPLRMRWARKDDVKKKGARNESEFYRKHGRQAGKETVNGRDMPGAGLGKRRRDDDMEDDAATRARLDEELDAFLAQGSGSEGEEEQATGRPLAERFSGEYGRGPSPDEDVLPSPPASPPSRMRSDYIADDGRTVIDKGDRWAHRDTSSSRQRVQRPRAGRGRRRRGNGAEHEMDLDDNRIGGRSLSDRIQTSDSGRWERSEHPPEHKRRRGPESDDRRRGHRRSESPRGDGGRDRRRGGGRTEPRPKKTQQELDDELDAFLQGA